MITVPKNETHGPFRALWESMKIQQEISSWIWEFEKEFAALL